MQTENGVKYRQKFLHNLSFNKVAFLYPFGILKFTSLTTISQPDLYINVMRYFKCVSNVFQGKTTVDG